MNPIQVAIEPIQGKKVEHTGVKIELLGQIGMLFWSVLLFSFSSSWMPNLCYTKNSLFHFIDAELYFDRGNFYDFTSLGEYNKKREPSHLFQM